MNSNKHYFSDENRIRYQRICHHDGVAYDWIFLPGGPGAESSYLSGLAEALELPGSSWLIDLPNNGGNTVSGEYDFDQWFELLLLLVSRFQKPIIVGHSFGGMFPLLFPQLEKLLSGFVILNSAPSLWLEEAYRVAAEKGKPSLDVEMQNFIQNPSPESFKVALMACAPYYFTDDTLAMGKQLLEQLPFNYHCANWWQVKAVELNFNAEWIPELVKTLIISGSEDCIVPSSLFMDDSRFKRDNIKRVVIENAGHMPWIDDMSRVKTLFASFIESLDD